MGKQYIVEEKEDGYYVTHKGRPFVIFPFLIIKGTIIDKPIKWRMAHDLAMSHNESAERCPVRVV